MSVQNENTKRWIKEAKTLGAKYILDVLDTFDYEHYPVYIYNEADVSKTKEKYNNEDMQEVYSIITVED